MKESEVNSHDKIYKGKLYFRSIELIVLEGEIKNNHYVSLDLWYCSAASAVEIADTIQEMLDNKMEKEYIEKACISLHRNSKGNIRVMDKIELLKS